LRARFTVLIVIIQAILLGAHWFIYKTWVDFRAVPDSPGITKLQIAVGGLAFSFVGASLLAYRYRSRPVKLFYRVAAAWLGTVNFLFLAAGFCWILGVVAGLARLPLPQYQVVTISYGVALLASLYGMVNARWLRVRRIQVKLPNLPESWRGRVAALASDLHLGHVNGARFLQRIVARLTRLAPDVVFLTGDLYDGTKVDPAEVAAPLRDLAAPLGTFFVTGNHEEFSDPSGYLRAVHNSGVRVLNGEKVTVDGLQIVGVPYHETINPTRFQEALERAAIEPGRASVLLSHAPHALPAAEQAGISMQLSGHTHGGQFFPFTWFTRRIFRAYTYGLQRFRDMLVYTTTGAGTWGPPMRVGTHPEIVLIEFV
jgi:predicted MPP superfamily phosphohydrolase